MPLAILPHKGIGNGHASLPISKTTLVIRFGSHSAFSEIAAQKSRTGCSPAPESAETRLRNSGPKIVLSALVSLASAASVRALTACFRRGELFLVAANGIAVLSAEHQRRQRPAQRTILKKKDFI